MSVIRNSHHYPLDFKMKVIREVMDGKISKEEANRKYGIKGHSTITTWIRKFEGVYKRPESLTNNSKMDSTERLAYEQRIKELEKSLEDEKLKSKAYELVIEIAEKELKIPIRKKSNTKQSK